MLRKSDFQDEPALSNDSTRRSILAASAELAHRFADQQNPLLSLRLGDKPLCHVKALGNRLILRKLRENILETMRGDRQSRHFIVSHLTYLLSEGVPYRLYRLDIKNFYESFDITLVRQKLESLEGLSPLSKKLLATLLNFYVSTGGRGLPRGLALSATLSELMMKGFDHAVAINSGAYFYYRYVDDIVIMTNSAEGPRFFLKKIKNILPANLALHGHKTQICKADLLPKLGPAKVKLFDFDYLGYNITVFDPARVAGVSSRELHREVSVDIAQKKIAKIKTRIVRSFLSFKTNHDFQLLLDRIRYLTTNISVKDLDRNTYKLAGIYHNYPHLTLTSASSLNELDKFLRIAVTSTKGRVFSVTCALLSRNQKKELLKHSFVRGHRERIYSYFHPLQIRRVLDCWTHAK